MEDYIEILLILIIGIIVLVFNFTSKIKKQRELKERDEYLRKLEKFELPLDSIKINGFNWEENNPVDIEGNELDAKDPFLYNTGYSYSGKGKYYEYKAIRKFKTKLYITIPYFGNSYKIQVDFPMEDTIIRMEFHMKKSLTIYKEAIKNGNGMQFRFLLDFRFLEDGKGTIIYTNFFR